MRVAAAEVEADGLEDVPLQADDDFGELVERLQRRGGLSARAAREQRARDVPCRRRSCDVRGS